MPFHLLTDNDGAVFHDYGFELADAVAPPVSIIGSDHFYDVDEGTAIVWSASLLHEVQPVTAGRRFILGAHLYG